MRTKVRREPALNKKNNKRKIKSAAPLAALLLPVPPVPREHKAPSVRVAAAGSRSIGVLLEER